MKQRHRDTLRKRLNEQNIIREKHNYLAKTKAEIIAGWAKGNLRINKQNSWFAFNVGDYYPWFHGSTNKYLRHAMELALNEIMSFPLMKALHEGQK